MRKRSHRGDGRKHERVAQREGMVWNQQGHFAVAQATRRSVQVIGLWLISASLVSGLLWQVIWIVDVNHLVLSEDIAPDGIDDLPGRPRHTVRLAHVLADVRGLGIPIRRRRCRDCRQLYCDCVVWRVVHEGRHA